MATERRKLGNSGLEVSPLCLGGNVFGWTADEKTSFKILDAMVESDINFIDTADVYSKWAPGNQGGESETIIGRWLKQSGKRDQVVIATKVGMELSPEKQGLAPSYIVRAVEDSLRRLQTDHIDLYQAHTDDQKTPLEDTLSTFSELIKQGKVRAIGASNYKKERLQQALEVSKRHGFARYESLQPEYNLYDRADYETNLEPLCLKEGLGVIPYYSLASGFLTGKYRSKADLKKSARGSRVQNYLNERGLRILNALDQVAKQVGSKPAAVALAWLMARPSITAPIASATSVDQLQDLVASTRLELDQQAIDLLDQASSDAAEPLASAG
jgi:aryl-alcohol dehydrogenase-like predicted oxidoreductase